MWKFSSEFNFHKNSNTVQDIKITTETSTVSEKKYDLDVNPFFWTNLENNINLGKKQQ